METPKPHDFRADIKVVTEAFTDAVATAETALIELGENLKTAVKKPYVPKEHLTQRPFLNKDLVKLRNSLQSNKKRGKK